jgi:Ran GTPase-activating protein (RanGAP) involved in mRNA processing and transport
MSNPMIFSQLIDRRCIDLSFNGLHDGNIDVLIDVICNTKVLHSLNLWGNRLSLDEVVKKEEEAETEEETETKTESETESETVAEIETEKEKEKEKCNLADAIARNATIRVLSLGGNDITASGGRRLADALRVNATICELHLGDNRLGDEGATHVASALGTSSTTAITTLGMYGNGITDVGARCIASSIRLNVRLRHLWLHGNRMSHVGYDEIVAAIRHNRRIESALLLSERHDGEIRAILDARRDENVEEAEGTEPEVEAEVGAEAEAVNEEPPPSSIVKEMDNSELSDALSAKDEEIATLKAELRAKDVELEAKNEEIAALLQCIAEGWKGALPTRAAAALVQEDTTTAPTNDVAVAVSSSFTIKKRNTLDVPSYEDDVRDDIDDVGHDADEELNLLPALSVE